jgi:PAS domain S-box-containing protein
MSLDLDFLKLAFENGLDAVGAIDDDWVVRYWNAPLEALSGVSAARALGTRLDDAFPKLRGSEAQRVLQHALAGDGAAGSAPFFAAADRKEAHDQVWFATPLCLRGHVEGAAFVSRGFIGRGQIREQMTEAEQRFRAMADGSPVLLWMAGRDARCDFFNATWLAFSGRTLDEEFGFGWASGVHPEDLERCMNTYMAAFSERRPFEMEYRLRRHDGQYRWLLDRGAPRWTPSGDFAGFIGSCVDITDRIAAEHATQKLAAELRRSNEYMEKLLYATSHDLREPMRMVATYVEMLERHLVSTADAEAKRYMDFAREGASRMRRMVDDLLSFASIRRAEPRMESVSLPALIHAMLAELAPAIAEAKADIIVDEMPTVRGDPVLLRSVFSNLLGNALKFRGDAPARVHFRAARKPGEHVLCVADSGIGFQQEHAERAFEMFQRLHSRERYPGSGIGLALVKDIVERHGGRIWAEAAPNTGACFYVALPEVP